MRVWRSGTTAAWAAAAVLVLAAGCTASPSAPPAPPATSEAPASSAAPTSASAAAGCPDGRYTITRLEGRGSASALGTGTGGDLVVDFTDGRWTLSSDGASAMSLDVGPTTVKLTFDGTITGDYTGTADDLGMTVTDTTGTASVKGFGIDRQVSARKVADQLVPSGTTGSATCTDQQTTITLPTVIITATR